MKVCPKCGTQYPDDANFCPIDAARLVAVDKRRLRSSADVRPGTDGPAEEDERLLGGRFDVGARIGGSLTGSVHRAEDRKHDRGCAVKLVDPAVFPNSLLMQRTERELNKLTRLSVPGIAKIYGYGRRGGTMWIATEIVPDCRSLHDIVFDDGPMDVQRAAGFIVKVGRALAEAAKMGVIHRDLAPKNVLVRPDGGVKIINFGVAVPTTDKVHGVAEFVAPEIIEGKPVDQRANIYSLGAVFYYLLTGRPPYMGEPEEVYKQHLQGSPEVPSIHSDDISDAVDILILRALARSSSKRFMTLRQLLSDVERVAAGEEPLSAAVSVGAAGLGRGKRRQRRLSSTMLGGFTMGRVQTTNNGVLAAASSHSDPTRDHVSDASDTAVVIDRPPSEGLDYPDAGVGVPLATPISSTNRNVTATGGFTVVSNTDEAESATPNSGTSVATQGPAATTADAEQARAATPAADRADMPTSSANAPVTGSVSIPATEDGTATAGRTDNGDRTDNADKTNRIADETDDADRTATTDETNAADRTAAGNNSWPGTDNGDGITTSERPEMGMPVPAQVAATGSAEMQTPADNSASATAGAMAAANQTTSDPLKSTTSAEGAGVDGNIAATTRVASATRNGRVATPRAAAQPQRIALPVAESYQDERFGPNLARNNAKKNAQNQPDDLDDSSLTHEIRGSRGQFLFVVVIILLVTMIIFFAVSM